MKRIYITTLVTALVLLGIFTGIHFILNNTPEVGMLKVGFILESDNSTPYTYNFALAQDALEKKYPGRVQVLVRSNVPDTETEEPLRDLIRQGCGIIFANNYSSEVYAMALEYPNVQFCQASFPDAQVNADADNFHTFNAEIYQGRYISGIVAGIKLREMIDSGVITADQALVGFVGGFPSPEVISGYTAFLLGVRSVAPEATMRVRYIGTWCSYSKEKASAKALIDEGCVIICQHTNTFGPAMACEEASATRKVYHVGYNQSMIDVAPATSLVSTRINWTPYILQAVAAVLEHKPIEKVVGGKVHGNDVGAGFDEDWVEVLELNDHIAVHGTQGRINRAVEAFRKGGVNVFKGNYIGVDPDDPNDTCDLSKGYIENAEHSYPTFHYVLKDIITVEE